MARDMGGAGPNRVSARQQVLNVYPKACIDRWPSDWISGTRYRYGILKGAGQWLVCQRSMGSSSASAAFRAVQTQITGG